MKLSDALCAVALINAFCLMPCRATTCESLGGLKLPDATILLAQTVAAGEFIPSTPFPATGPRGGLTFVSAQDLPEFCRIATVSKPTLDFEIKFEVWMPTAHWNGKFAGVGNGGMAGSLNYAVMAALLARGYATSSTQGRSKVRTPRNRCQAGGVGRDLSCGFSAPRGNQKSRIRNLY